MLSLHVWVFVDGEEVFAQTFEIVVGVKPAWDDMPRALAMRHQDAIDLCVAVACWPSSSFSSYSS